MKREVGLWIDHRKTVIVAIENKVEKIREIESNMEKHTRFSSGTHSKTGNEAQGSTAEDMRGRQFGEHLGRYYEAVISMIKDADSIWIFGPGEAKIELANNLKRSDLGGRIVGVETVDKMTNQQIAARVRKHFVEE
jgi:hypothetical protein